MNKNTGNKNMKRRPKPKPKKGKRKNKKVSGKTLIMFLLFEFIFTACTFPFLLLYGPFNNAKSTYVGAAMTSMTHQYLATWFLSEEKINKILGNNSTEATDETTNASEINIPKVKDDTIEFYELADNPKFTGYYLVVKDPTRVKVGRTTKLNEEGQTTSQIAENYNAVAAVNGGAFVDQSSTSQWTGNGGIPSGIVMSGGEVVHNDLGEGNKTELLAIDKQGVMIVGKYSIDDLKERKIQEALSFGPTLVVNGKMTPMSGDGGWGIAPRTAIGQRQDGAIILLVIDGRGVGSLGATLKETQEIMYQLGAVNAMNLDGGKSTTLYYDGEVRNTPSNSMGERAIPTAIIVK
ncbi:phosphodiester glycosidase family protein [Clostridium butyricum]|uniref:Exopolysaccharide biosynthesis protein n=1 Tax=Clostridium butyricum TaxID=1492 RepID=A0A2S7F544_CLOBU|nr:phosphodiester glycosidase family protein [Clostridium butyricum]KHD15654.1 exopolysaccharide biosynthesis protein [Clostridium butyricum]MDB2152570.1 phosphodiester glycosidase family protein [Clostridium butyricum]PPV12004.1 exopolysaccharide biosynthesis protein [Clostridium butyricum]